MRIWFTASANAVPPYSLRWSMSALALDLRHYGHTVTLYFSSPAKRHRPFSFSLKLAIRLVLQFWKRPHWIIAHATDGLPCTFLASLFRMKTKVALFTNGWSECSSIIEHRLPATVARNSVPLHRRFLQKLLLNVALNYSSLCILGTIDEARWFKRHRPTVAKKCIVIPSGIRISRKPYWPEQEEFAPSFLLTGQFSWMNNLEYGIELFRRILAVNSAARLFIVGCGPLGEKSEQLLFSLGDAVFTVDSEASAKMYRWYESCPFLLLPSRYEPQRPPAVLEAQSRGCIVFGADIPPVRECITPGVNGFLISGVNPVGDADLLLRIIGNSDLIRRISLSAGNHASRQTIRRQGNRLLRALLRR